MLKQTIFMIFILALLSPLVQADTTAPIAVISGVPEIVSEGMTLTLDASNSSGDIDLYQWQVYAYKSNGQQYIYKYVYDMKFDLTFSFIGHCNVLLSIRDTSGVSDNIQIRIDVVDIIPPIAIGNGNETIHTREYVILNGSESYDNDAIAYYNWSIDSKKYSGMIQNITFNDDGVYNVTLTVYDMFNLSGVDTFTVTVLDTIPIIHTTINGEDVRDGERHYTDGPGELCRIDASNTESYHDIIEYNWQIETDTYEGNEILFRPTDEGEYGVLLIVMNSVYETDSVLIYIDTREPIIEPVVRPIDNDTDIPDVNGTVINVKSEEPKWFHYVSFAMLIIAVIVVVVLIKRVISKEKGKGE